MNKVIILVLVVVVLVGGGYFMMKGKSSMAPMGDQPKTETAPVAGNTVEIKDFAYSPASLSVKVGDTVTWTNKDLTGHSATADDGSFDTGVLAQGESGSFTFTKAGTFAYHCTPHPNIQGTITVE